MNLGILGENQETQPVDQLEARRGISPNLFPLGGKKKIRRPNEAVKTGVKFIIRGAAQPVGERARREVVYFRQKQGINTRPKGECGCGRPPE